MKKTAAEIATKALEDTHAEAYVEGFVKRAAELGLPMDSEKCVKDLLKTAAALRKLESEVQPIIEPLQKQASEQFVEGALNSLAGVSAMDVARAIA